MIDGSRRTWHVLTGEFPPACGGVGDYSALVAAALAASGDAVHVWTPSDTPALRGTTPHRLPDAFGAASRKALTSALARERGTLLVQYVPNALGARGANLPFCRWLLHRRRAGDDVRVMFHEPYFYFTLRRPWRNALAVAQRAMAAILLRAASQVYFSSENWRRYLAPYGPVHNALTLPIPSTIPDPDAQRTDEWRRTLLAGADVPLIGHFGTYGHDIARTLTRVLPSILSHSPRARLVFVGAESDRFLASIAGSIPAIRERATATGRLTPDAIAAALHACDVLIQPYPDGVTTRRTSMMAALRNGRAVVTTTGFLTEAVWHSIAPAALAPVNDPDAFGAACARLLADPAARDALGKRGRAVYVALFALDHTLDALRGADTRVPLAG